MWYAVEAVTKQSQRMYRMIAAIIATPKLKGVKIYLIAQSKPLFTPAPDRANPAVSKLRMKKKDNEICRDHTALRVFLFICESSPLLLQHAKKAIQFRNTRICIPDQGEVPADSRAPLKLVDQRRVAFTDRYVRKS
jgi:hypothetical protein